MARRTRLGSGARFRAMTKKVGSKRLAAYIGRRSLGKRRFQKLAAAGRRRAARRRRK